MSHAVILDPYGPYAPLLIESLYAKRGIRTVCLHSDWATRLKVESRIPVLHSAAVAAHYMTSMGWDKIVQRLRRHHEVVAVLPHDEGTVAPLARLAEDLGLSWSQPDVLPAFRDKARLKSLVATNDPTVRLNRFARVVDPNQALAFVRQAGLKRFVIKPNDGSGNTDVGFFDADGDLRGVYDHFDRLSGRPVLLEEFIKGPEFWINGQTDERGEPTVVSIGQYVRLHENGVENLEAGGITVPRSDPVFDQLRAYAESVIRATGLRRSPFHLEAIVDEQGPCLVEVAARFSGELAPQAEMWQHGPQLDLFDIAAHYYVSDEHYGPIPLDWERRDRTVVGQVSGSLAVSERVVCIEGIEEIEQSPAFLYWNKKPAVGDFVYRKVNLNTSAWSVTIAGQSVAEVKATLEWMRATLRLRGTADASWTLRERLPMYRGVAAKVWQARPRPYQIPALVTR
jgi:hypothetical protein